MADGRQVWLNDRLVDEGSASISIFDRGFLFGDGIYELVRYVRAAPETGARRYGVGLDLHVARLHRSLGLARISGFDAARLPAICEAVLDANDLCDAAVYLQVTRGVGSSRSHVPNVEVAPTVLAIASPAEPLERLREPSTVRAITMEDPRWRLCQIKTISLMGNILSLLEADRRGASEAILHRDGLVGEGAYTNVFVAKGGRLATPPVDDDPPILHGVTRSDILATGERLGVPIAVRSIRLDELATADEILITSSRRLISAVVDLDGQPVADGAIGPLARTLFLALREEIARRAGLRSAVPA